MPGSHFYDFVSDVEFAMNSAGTCKACPLDPDECYQYGFVTSIEGKQNCTCCMLDCDCKGTSHLTVNGKEVLSYPVYESIQKSYQNASSPLTDCSNLLLENEEKCPGAEGHVCIVDISVLGESEVGKLTWKLYNEAEGMVMWQSFYRGYGIYAYDELAIPFVFVLEEDGQQLLKSEHDLVT